ncbi:hypothetical protein AYI68_g7924 [Smittium mucronatum]|uniref:Procollagen galactosyltransferase 1 n=1 Tax=Smittium mucronatum TaxID=133383 RepID=A0A1R0GMA7_9FUNG|nr:hypothetical protein AYI68_g7924 [Smittium mucronatum]
MYVEPSMQAWWDDMVRTKKECFKCNKGTFTDWDPFSEKVKLIILNGRNSKTEQMESWSSLNPVILKTKGPDDMVDLYFHDNVKDFAETLNFIYYSFFDKIINVYKNEYFLVVEDDALLDNIEQLKEDVGCAIANKVGVYSLFGQGTSHHAYSWGTQAMLYSRSYLKEFRPFHLRNISFHPIDLLIASYKRTCKTNKSYIHHKGKRTFKGN